MIMSKVKETLGLAINVKIRKAGKMLKDGKEISWEDALQVTILPLEDEKGFVKKYSVKPEAADYINKKMDAVHWGALIALELDNNKIIDVEILQDCLASFYEEL